MSEYEVAKAAALLHVFGDPITVKAVRGLLGGGSDRDISRVLIKLGWTAEIRHLVSDDLVMPVRQLTSSVLSRIMTAIDRLRLQGIELNDLTVERVRREAKASPNDTSRVLRALRGPKHKRSPRPKRRRCGTDLPIVIDPTDDPDLGNNTNQLLPTDDGLPWVSAVDTRLEEGKSPTAQVHVVSDCT